MKQLRSQKSNKDMGQTIKAPASSSRLQNVTIKGPTRFFSPPTVIKSEIKEKAQVTISEKPAWSSAVKTSDTPLEGLVVYSLA